MTRRKKPKSRAKQLPATGKVPTAQTYEHQHQLPALPEAVLTAILQHVPLRDRLSACTLVCKSWAVAAASTTADMSKTIRGSGMCKQMQDWLEVWGEQVSSIDLHYCPEDNEEPNPFQSRLLLPCSKLTRLTRLALITLPIAFHMQQHSSGVSTRSRQRASTAQLLAAEASSSNGTRGSAASQRNRPAAGVAAMRTPSFLPALRELLLSDCIVRHDSFLQLSQLTGLTSLHLHSVVLCTASWAAVSEQQESKAFSAVLQQLKGLETLFLGRGVVLKDADSAAALSALSTMQRLQHLELSTAACRTAAHLAHIPTSLTRLQLAGCEEDRDIGGCLWLTTAALPQLPLLRAAQLTWVELDPGVLAQWSRLTELGLSNVVPQAPGIADAAPDDPNDSDWAEELQERQLKALLRELGKLTELKELMLSCMSLSKVEDIQLFTALTASTQLTKLFITTGDPDQDEVDDTMPLPSGALQHMFSPPQQWPLLQTLRLEVDLENGDYFDDDEWCVDALGISRLASCLPALDFLSLTNVVKDVDTVAALTQLMPGLTQLFVGGNVFDDNAAGFVAGLTSLQELDWSNSELTSVGLRALTALTNLDMLLVEYWPELSDSDNEGYYDDEVNELELYTSQEAEAAGKSDVWQQLQQLCIEGALNVKRCAD